MSFNLVYSKMNPFKSRDPFDRDFIFITGAPRSGTSMLTKVIDAHPDISILMENIFNNRRRHWNQAQFWKDEKSLRKEVATVYSRLKTPVVGNKVCTPDVWSADNILQFCKLFKDFKIIFIIRDPSSVIMSRWNRENYDAEFNQSAKENLLLDFRSRFLTYTSSWRQSIETYWKLRDGYPDKVKIVYYEEFCKDFEKEVRILFEHLNIDFHNQVLNWQALPHSDKHGNLKNDLKYKDSKTSLRKKHSEESLSLTNQEKMITALETISVHKELWLNRSL